MADDQPNVQFHQPSVSTSGLSPSSKDFGEGFGLLHHVSDTAAALLLVLLPLLIVVLYFRSIEAWLLRLMQRSVQRLEPS